MMGEIKLNIDHIAATVFPQAILRALNDACQIVENSAVEKCPVHDGILRASITHQVGQEDGAYVGAIGSNVEYAPYVHEGTGLYAKDGNGRKDVPWWYKDASGAWHSTSGQKPQPFLQDAIDENMDNILMPFGGILSDN